jgi:hypothetical protein
VAKIIEEKRVEAVFENPPEEVENIRRGMLCWGIPEQEAARFHKEGCRFRLAVLGAIPISCTKHGRDVCLTCGDGCTCGRGDEVFLAYLDDLKWSRFYTACFRILVDHAGARKEDEDNFVDAMMREVDGTDGVNEWRFMGSLGAGGKFWRTQGNIFVDCYPEDRTEERTTTITLVNQKLSFLQDKDIGGPIFGSPVYHNKSLEL